MYNVNGSWQPTEMYGTLMIRPVVGKSYYIGVEENGSSTDSETVVVYPNPASSVLNINTLDNTVIVTTSIYDLTGRKVYQNAFEKELPVDHLTDGLYFISLTTAQGQVITQKIVIRK